MRRYPKRPSTQVPLSIPKPPPPSRTRARPPPTPTRALRARRQQTRRRRSRTAELLTTTLIPMSPLREVAAAAPPKAFQSALCWIVSSLRCAALGVLALLSAHQVNFSIGGPCCLPQSASLARKTLDVACDELYHGGLLVQLGDGTLSEAIGVPVLSAALETTGMDVTLDENGADFTALAAQGEAAKDARAAAALAAAPGPAPGAADPPGGTPVPTANSGLGVGAMVGIAVGGVVAAAVAAAALALYLMRQRDVSAPGPQSERHEETVAIDGPQVRLDQAVHAWSVTTVCHTILSGPLRCRSTPRQVASLESPQRRMKKLLTSLTWRRSTTRMAVPTAILHPMQPTMWARVSPQRRCVLTSVSLRTLYSAGSSGAGPWAQSWSFYLAGERQASVGQQHGSRLTWCRHVLCLSKHGCACDDLAGIAGLRALTSTDQYMLDSWAAAAGYKLGQLSFH